MNMTGLRKIPLLFFLTVTSLPLASVAAPFTIENLRMWRAPDNTRLVFDLSGPIEHRLFTLARPDRVVLDLEKVQLTKPLPQIDLGGPMLSGIRTGAKDTDGLRIVLDLKTASKPRTYLLKPYDQYGYRLVVDLHQDDEDAKQAEPAAVPPSSPAEFTVPPRKSGPYVVAIDAGHGGEDPGAIGRRYKTYEKDVVLAIAKEVKQLIDKDPSMRAVMTRDGDYFVSLRKRVVLAQKKDADLFVSIHADSLPHSRARGSSVYALSQKGATSAQARLLADRENASDLIGGIDLNQTDDVLFKVLVDMQQTGTISSSMMLGQDLLTDLGKAGPVHIKNVGQAGFAVLKSAEFPSVLVETTFISHPGEERKLRSRAYQKKVAHSIYSGIRRFVRRNTLRPRTGSDTVARSAGQKVHIVQRGDTLFDIAQTYSVNVSELKLANNMRGSKLIVGKRLVIPN